MLFFKISYLYSCLQPILTQKLTSMRGKALFDYTTTGLIEKKKNLVNLL